ncbi:hypothetical protein CFOL_v3_01236, partial [Cephalotus follicularis]
AFCHPFNYVRDYVSMINKQVTIKKLLYA